MMRILPVCFILWSFACAESPEVGEASSKSAEASLAQTQPGQSSAEAQVLKGVAEMVRKTGGRVTFSELHNNPGFKADEKKFLGRLYEIFFEIPGYLKTQASASGSLPTRQQIGDNFSISKQSVELLLTVMEMDPRVPQLFDRDPMTKEIVSLDGDMIEAFLTRRGHSVRVSWQDAELPSFELQSVDGSGAIASRDLKDKASLVYFWFSGCPPCVRIAPHLTVLDKKYRDKGFRIVGVNADQILSIPTTQETRMAYLEKVGVEFANVHLTKEAQEDFGNVNVYPTLFFVGPDLKIDAHMINYQDLPVLESAVQDLIGRL